MSSDTPVGESRSGHLRRHWRAVRAVGIAAALGAVTYLTLGAFGRIRSTRLFEPFVAPGRLQLELDQPGHYIIYTPVTKKPTGLAGVLSSLDSSPYPVTFSISRVDTGENVWCDAEYGAPHRMANSIEYRRKFSFDLADPGDVQIISVHRYAGSTTEFALGRDFTGGDVGYVLLLVTLASISLGLGVVLAFPRLAAKLSKQRRDRKLRATPAA